MASEKIFMGYQAEGAWFQQIAAELGMSPFELWESESSGLLSLVTSVDEREAGHIDAGLRGNASLRVDYDPATMIVMQVAVSVGGQSAYLWQGSMSADEFLREDWPVEQVYGSAFADSLWVGGGGATTFAGAGNDIIEMNGCSAGEFVTAFGEEGQDAFVVSGFGNVVIGDYQAGEKILFSDYDSMAALVEDFAGVGPAAGVGFTLNFQNDWGEDWSLTIENFSIDNMRIEDLLADEGSGWGIYGPYIEAMGVSAQALSDEYVF